MDSASLMARYGMMLALVSGETVSFDAFTISTPSNVVDLAAVRQARATARGNHARFDPCDEVS
jgi:hypothetical protein